MAPHSQAPVNRFGVIGILPSTSRKHHTADRLPRASRDGRRRPIAVYMKTTIPGGDHDEKSLTGWPRKPPARRRALRPSGLPGDEPALGGADSTRSTLPSDLVPDRL